MGKPEKKLKKILLIMGITGAVYGSFRFLLPLVIPFLNSFDRFDRLFVIMGSFYGKYVV